MRLGILGGCFNPVHAGHLRLALEALERLDLDRVDVTPCFRPPHKAESDLLDFPLRVRLAEQAVADLPGLSVSTVEAQLPAPSYTVGTLEALREHLPAAELFFILGAGDLLALPRWRQGLDLVRLAHFVVAPRAEDGPEAVRSFVAATWPGQALPAPPPQGATEAWRFPAPGQDAETLLLLLPAPTLDISSSAVRQAWRQGRSLRCLVPEAVERELLARAEEVSRCWGPRPERHAHRI